MHHIWYRQGFNSFLKRLADRLTRDALDNLQSHQLIAQQAKRPTGSAFRSLAAANGDQLRFLLTIEHPLTRRTTLFLAFNRRIKALFHKPPANDLDGARPDRKRLDELLAANQALMTIYVLRDDLKELWRLRDTEAACAAWNAWFSRAMESGLKPLIAFARRLAPYLHGILAHAKWPLHTSLLEGINNKIKVIKRAAYGFRDDDYFFLKIRDAFPGIG